MNSLGGEPEHYCLYLSQIPKRVFRIGSSIKKSNMAMIVHCIVINYLTRDDLALAKI